MTFLGYVASASLFSTAGILILAVIKSFDLRFQPKPEGKVIPGRFPRGYQPASGPRRPVPAPGSGSGVQRFPRDGYGGMR